MSYLKVEGHSNLIRDPKTNSIINTSMSDYQEYLNRKNIASKGNEKIESIEEDLANMKSDLDEIKFLLRSLINEPR
jgi:hypothetical protein